jgi:cell fate regulator YaaT (PSP1 superfamily)
LPHVIEVAFKGNRKDFFIWDHDELPAINAAVIVDADRGEDLGRVHALGDLAAKRNAGVPHGYGLGGEGGAEGGEPSKKARRLATADEARRATDLRTHDEDARRKAMERVKANDLVMKLTDAEWQWDRKKLTFYFTADKRVDFRNLVRELAAMFRTRIELKQIGVRDEAKRLDGIGRCGRQYCSSSWLPELRPVNLGVAKDQRLSLNPSQISGACGRLMCCLRYEHEFYVQSRKRFPKEGKILRTSKGEEKVVSNDIFRDRVTLRGLDGEFRIVPLAELRGEIDAAALAAGGAGDAGNGSAVAMAVVVASLELELEEVVGEAAGGGAWTEVEGEIVEVDEPGAGARRGPALRPAPDARDRSAERDTAGDTPAEAPGSSSPGGSDASEDRKPHRRRGRRGGRRNKAGGPSGQQSPGAGGSGSAPPSEQGP